jgi:uncharacterized membrane protein YvbJ
MNGKTMKRRKTMTKFLKLILALAIAAVVVFFILFSIYMLNKDTENKLSAELQDYSARKEDLMLQQQKIETLINKLNETLQLDLANEKKLESELNNITKEKGILDAIRNETAPSAPKPAPPPPIVTRAS